MSGISFIELYVFVLAAFVGYQVISRVPPLLHTPLMSATNAISGISLVGSLVLAGADYGTLATWLGFIAVTRSEEHTSELQSHSDLVCRLLLEKKKHNYGVIKQ